MLQGTWRLVHKDSNDNTIAELLEKHNTEFGGVMGTPESDPQKMVKVKKQLSTILKEDDKLVVMFKPTVALTTIAAVGTSGIKHVRMPITFRNRRSGVRFEKTLVAGDFTDLHPDADGFVFVVGIWYDQLEYKIPAQSEVKLGHALQDVRVDSAMVLQRDVETS